MWVGEGWVKVWEGLDVGRGRLGQGFGRLECGWGKAVTSILCLLYSPKTVHCNTESVHL